MTQVTFSGKSPSGKQCLHFQKAQVLLKDGADIPTFFILNKRPHMKIIKSADDNKVNKEAVTNSKKTAQK
jgi:hypothetical protein